MDRNDAIETLNAIQTRQVELSARGDEAAVKTEQIEKKVEDLVAAHRALTERAFVEPEPYGGDSKLAEYANVDDAAAPVNWTTRSMSTRLPSGTTVQGKAHGLLTDPAPADEWHATLVRDYTTRNLARMAQRMSGGTANTPNLDVNLYRHLQACPSPVLRAAITKAFSDTTNVGAEWIPDDFLPSVYQEFQTPRRLRALLQPIAVTNNTLLRPTLTRGARPYVKGQITTDDPRKYTASTPQTADKTISMSGLSVLVYCDDAALEDSAVAAAQILRREIVAALEDGFEDAMVNGDSNATHQDAIATWNIRSRWGASGLGGDSDHRRLFLGWRAKAFDSSATTDVSGTMNVANFATMMGVLGERGTGNLIGVVSPEALVTDFLKISEVLTVDNYGPNATILSGQLASFMGVPLIVSRFMSADLAASGLFTGSGALTSSMLVDLDGWQRYTKRGATVEVDKEIVSGTVAFVATIREVMDSPDAAATKNVSLAINL